MSQLQTSNWSDTPANNNAATPNGWPEGQNPDTVNDCAREMMSALKINFNHVHGLDSAGALLSSGGTSTAYTVTYSTAPATLYTGFLFGVKIHTDCGAAPTVNVNALGAVNIQKPTPAGLANLAAGDLRTGMFALMRYDATLAKAILLTPVAAGGLQTLWIPAGSMISRTTNGAASGTTELATNKNMLRTLDFDATTQEFAQFDIAMPASWNLGTVTAQPLWTAASGSGGVVWAIQGVATSDDDAMDVAFGTEQTSTDTLLAANDCHIAPTSAAITIAGTPAANDRVQIQIKRNVADVSDTLAVDAKLVGLRLFYTVNAGNDS